MIIHVPTMDFLAPWFAESDPGLYHAVASPSASVRGQSPQRRGKGRSRTRPSCGAVKSGRRGDRSQLTMPYFSIALNMSSDSRTTSEHKTPESNKSIHEYGREGAVPPPLPGAPREPATAPGPCADNAPTRPRPAAGHSPPPAHHRPGPTTGWHPGSGQWAR